MAQRDFTIDGIQFRQRNLGSEDSLRGLNWLIKAISQASVSAADLQSGTEAAMIAAISGAVGALEDLPKFSALFTPYSQCDLASIAEAGALPQGNNYSALTNVKEQVFGGGNVGRHVAWLVDCVAWEYGSFLHGAGRRPLVEMANRLKSLISSTAGSGASTATS